MCDHRLTAHRVLNHDALVARSADDGQVLYLERPRRDGAGVTLDVVDEDVDRRGQCLASAILRHLQRHQIVTQSEHHQGIPLGRPSAGKTLVHIQQGAPVVEQRPLAAYESLETGGAR